MQEPQSLERLEARPLRDDLVADLLRQPLSLPARRPEDADQPDVVDHVGEVAADVGRLARELLVKVAAAGRDPDDYRPQDHHHHEQHRSELPVDRSEHGDAEDHREAGRDRGPRQLVLDRPRGVGRGRDAPGEGARKLLDEISRPVAGQVIEEIEAQVGSDRGESVRRGPPGHTPQEVVARDDREEDTDRPPERLRRRRTGAQHVDQVLHRVLRTDRARYRGDDRGDDDDMASHPPRQRNAAETGSVRARRIAEGADDSRRQPRLPRRRVVRPLRCP